MLTNAAQAALNPGTGKSIGGNMNHTYTYDKLYRLSTAEGHFDAGSGKAASYRLDMAYDNLHNVIYKKQQITQTGVQFDGTMQTGYKLAYTYHPDNAQQIVSIKDVNYRGEQKDSVTQKQWYMYDKNGNMLYMHTSGSGKAGNGLERRLLWDEENRLTAISDNGYISSYLYDASGERTLKIHGASEGVYIIPILHII